MKDILSMLSLNLNYESQYIIEDTIYIKCRVAAIPGYHIHSYYYRHIKDLNIGDKKTILVIKCPKYYVDRTKNNKTFTFPLEFADIKLRITKRLTEYIEKSVTEVSAIGLERIMNKGIARISDSTILRIIKKKHM